MWRSTVIPSRTWAFLPARANSKTIHHKNIVALGGRPLLSYAVDAARAAGLSRVVVSTDGAEIAKVAEDRGAEAVRRPDELAGDAVSTDAVVRGFLVEEQRAGRDLPEFLAVMQPTSPFVTPETVRDCLEALARHPEAQSVQSVTPVTHHNHAINQRLVEGDEIRFRFPELRAGVWQKQAKAPHYALGNFIALRVAVYLMSEEFFGASVLGGFVSRFEAVDIDAPEDLQQAEAYLAAGLLPQLKHPA